MSTECLTYSRNRAGDISQEEPGIRADLHPTAVGQLERSERVARADTLLKSWLARRREAEWIGQGRPDAGKVCPPRAASRSGLLSLTGLSKYVARRWREADFEPIELQDSRDTAATWLDHAGVAPKVASVFMGHKAPKRHLHPDAAPITLRRYTHVLPGELERARDLLDSFLAARELEEEGRAFR